jgi:hypothetical protein
LEKAMSAVQAIPNSRVVVLFLVMLVAAAGNTAMQSALPAIASELDMPDVWVSLALAGLHCYGLSLHPNGRACRIAGAASN